MTEYPADLERPGLLRDGRSILIRPGTVRDSDAVLDFYGRLSRRSVAFRTLGPVVTMDRASTEEFLDNDFHGRLVLLATLDDRVIGMADYTRSSEDRADVGFTVEDAFQGMGMGGLLLEHLAAAARDRGITVFDADVLAENLPMLRTLQSSGYRVEFGEPGSVQHVDVAIDPQRRVLARSDRRERVAIGSSLGLFFAPKSVAVIGASRKPRTVGNALFRNLREGGLDGPVYPVNPNITDIDGVACVKSVRELDSVDLAVVAVRADIVTEVLQECVDSGIRAVIVVSAGMESGRDAQELVRLVRGHDMRMIGPNCMGVVSLSVRGSGDLVATFSPAVPPRGRVSMVSQSGPLGLAILDHARRLNLGFRGFVSLGDSFDVSSNDLLQWWGGDRSTGVVLLHLDKFGNPRKFARAAQRLSLRKPVIAVHPGSFTRSAPSGADEVPTDSDAVLDALFSQTGVIRTRTMQEMFDTALLLANQPVPAGPRVAILTNAAGPGALTLGASRSAGLVSAEPASATREALDAIGATSSSNPVDLRPDATAEQYREALRALLSDFGVDAVIVLFLPPLIDESDSVAQALVAEAGAVPTKPVVASFVSTEGLIDELRVDDRRTIPSYRFPESAATALGRAAAYGNWLRLPVGVVKEPPGISVSDAKSLVAACGPGVMNSDRVRELLGCFGLAVIETSEVSATHATLTLRVLDDPIFGPVLALGSAPEIVDVFGDVAYRVTPLTDRDALAMVESLRTYPVLAGLRDVEAVDLDAVVDLLMRVSMMVEVIPEVSSIRSGALRVGGVGEKIGFTDVTILLNEPSQGRPVREATVDRS